ncbi:hypothetical protein Tco_1107523 [Tanacetum coccineum]
MKAIVEEGESSEDDWNHYSQLTNLKDQEHEPLINIGDNSNYNPYLGVNRIFGGNGRARNIGDIQDEREPKDHDGIGDLQGCCTTKELASAVSMTLEIQKNLEDRPAIEILQELKTMFQQQAEQELFETVKAFHACKQEEGQSVSTYVLKMKAYLDHMEYLGYPML